MDRHRHYLGPLFDPRSVLVLLEGRAPLEPWLAALIDAQRDDSLAQGRAFAIATVAEGGPAPRFAPDLVLVVTTADGVVAALELAAGWKAVHAVVFAEHDDRASLQAWAGAARRLGVRLLGPGTMGFVRPRTKLNASRLAREVRPGPVALVTQSGMLGSAILDWAGGTAIGFSLVVSMGQEIDVDLDQVLDFLASDAHTHAVVMYVEAVRDARGFMSALRALAATKPVIVLNGGSRAEPAARAHTHSGAIAASSAVYSAAFRRAGAVQVRQFTQLFTAVRCLASRTWPAGVRVAVVANGHGPAVLAADQARVYGLRIGPVSDGLARALRSALPAVEPANPCNLGTFARAPDYGAALAAFVADPDTDAVLVVMSPCVGIDASAVAAQIAQAGAATRKPVFVCLMGEATTREPRLQVDAAGLPVFRTPEAAVDAYGTIVTFLRNQQLLLQTPKPLSELEAPDLVFARGLVTGAVTRAREVLTERESKALLEAFHIPLTRTALAVDADAAVALAERIGYPVVLKVESPDVAHKSDVGGVVLDVRDAAEVRTQFARIVESVRDAQPGARVAGVTVQPMRRSRHGRELFIGVFQDPDFGPVIAFGAGGTRIEVLRDVTLEFPPLNGFLARRMIERTRVAETLGAFRGAPAVDLERIEAILVRVSELVCELPQVRELDLNPLIADEHGTVVVDARIVVDARPRPDARAYSHLAIMPYPPGLTRETVLRDGRRVLLRPIRPDDAERLQRFMGRLSDQSRYFRFISTMRELPQKMLARYTQIDYDREMAIVAVALPGEGGTSSATGADEIVGVARYLLYPDRETSEYALAVADAYQGQGLGSTLMTAINAVGKARGLRRTEGYVLAQNEGMLRLMQRLGFVVDPDPEDPAMRIVWKSLVE